MPRRRVAAKRTILPDPKFGSELLAKFINCIMLNGEKSIAEKIVYDALIGMARQLKDRLKSVEGSGSIAKNWEDGQIIVEQFSQIIDNVGPDVEICPRRVGGATYQIPREVRQARRVALAMRSIKKAARRRNERTMALRLAAELVDAYFNKGAAVKAREDTHRMAKANQAYAHFRWT